MVDVVSLDFQGIIAVFQLQCSLIYLALLNLFQNVLAHHTGLCLRLAIKSWLISLAFVLYSEDINVLFIQCHSQIIDALEPSVFTNSNQAVFNLLLKEVLVVQDLLQIVFWIVVKLRIREKVYHNQKLFKFNPNLVDILIVALRLPLNRVGSQ